MPRNGSGTFSLAEAPFVPNTPISSSAVNNDLSDIADGLTDSLSRTGLGGMTAQLPLATSGFAYSADPDTGMQRTAANTQVVRVGGVDWEFTPTDLTSPTGATFSGAQPLIGEIRMWALPTAPTGWLFLRGQQCTTDYPLWRAALVAASNPYGTGGGHPLFPNFQCRLPAGFDADGLGLLTGATTLGNAIGQQSRTIAQANLPNVNFTVDIPSGQGSHSHPPWPGAGDYANFSGSAWGLGGGDNQGGFFSGTGPATLPAMTGTAASGGSGTALTTIQPTLIINFIGRAA